MALLFNSLLTQFGIEASKVRLLRHKDSRAHKGCSPYEMWRDNRPAFEFYQHSQSIENRAKLRAEYWAAFVVPGSGETLFAGFYGCQHRGVNEHENVWRHAPGSDAPGTCDLYDLVRDERFADLEGRLVIDWGASERAWVQRADNQNKTIVELRTAFKEPDFPGFLRFAEPLSKIESLPLSWVTSLRATRGVYLLTCPRTQEQYVGSAYGEDGFYGRWLAYVANSHGGNVELKSRDPSDYQVVILEVAGSFATQAEIVEMETLWKRKLQSRAMGLNRN